MARPVRPGTVAIQNDNNPNGNSGLSSSTPTYEDYKPNKKERELLDVLLNPENRLKHVNALCDLAGLSRKSYYRMFKRPGFVALYKKESKALVYQAYAPALHTLIKETIRGSAEHAKIYFRMTGDLDDSRKSIVFPGKDGQPQDITGGAILDNMQRAVRIAYLLEMAEHRKALEPAEANVVEIKDEEGKEK
jgi:hypothetical protein